MPYKDSSSQAAFDRWVDLMAELLQKYGPAYLKTLKEHNMPTAVTGNALRREQNMPLEESLMAA